MFILNKLQLVYRTLRINFKFFILFCGTEYPDQLFNSIFKPLFCIQRNEPIYEVTSFSLTTRLIYCTLIVAYLVLVYNDSRERARLSRAAW